jgi:hypothetical protein
MIGGYWGQTFTDNASNSAYSSGWNNSSNGGSGFQAWNLSSDGVNAGRFIGNPSDAGYGMSSSGIGSTAFGLYGHTSQYSYAIRNFNSSLAIGDILSFQWSMNYDCGNSGSKGWELRSGSTNIFGVSNTNSSVISYNGVTSGTVSSNYGTSSMLVTIQRISGSQYSVSISRRNTADGTFSTTISSSSAIDNIRIYIGSQETNAGQRNIFFNNFQIQKPDQYRSKTSGNWSAAGSWEVSTNGGSTWSTAASPPGSTLYSAIIIRTGHTISQNQSYTSGSNNNISVESGGILNMTGALGDFQFSSMSVSGTLSRNNASFIYSGSITINNGGKYSHAVDGGSVPTCTWNSGSTFEVTGIASQVSFSSGAIQNYHHIVWNCPSQSGTFSFGGLTTVNGNLTVQSTGASPSSSSCLLLTNSSTLAATISGNLSITGGYFAPFGSSTSGNCSLAVGGDLSLATGTFDIFRQASNTSTINLSGNFTMTSGTLTKAGAGTGYFNFAKSGTQTYAKSGGTISTAINFTVNNGSTLDMGTSLIDGSTGTYTLSSGGGLITANTSGITSSGASGAIQVSGTRTYNTGANYTFNGSSAQVTGNGLTGAANITINNSSGVTLTSNTSLSGTLTLTNGVLTVGSTNTITVSSGGSITATSGSLASGTGAGTVAFSGTGTISGTIGFNDVNIAGGVNFGSASTVNGTLSINAGGFVNSNAPIYASGSTLKYNSGGTYGRGTEWSATSAAGYPHHVQISTGTILDLGANGMATARQIGGNMTVDIGTTLSMALNPMTAALTVKGNYFNYGTTILSSSSGGDLVLEGNLTDNATFTANGRAIFFRGSNTQSISSSDNPLDIDVARFNKTGGEVILLQNLLIDETADPVQFAGTSILNLNGYTATFGKTGTTSSITMNSTSAIKGSANSHLTIYGNGAFGAINFDQTGTNNQLGNLLIQRGSGSVSLGNAVTINGSLTLSVGKLIIGANTLTLAGTVASMNESNCLVGSSTSNLTVNGTGTLGTLYFDQTTPGTTNYLNGFALNRTSSGTMNLANNLQLASLTITNGEFIINASKQLTVNGVLTNNGIFTLNNAATLVQGASSTLAGSGTYNIKQTVTGSGGSSPNGRFWYLGSPLSNGSSTALLSNSNQLWQWNEGGGGNTIGYATVSSGQTLTQGKSYVLRSGQNETINFSGTGLSNGTVTVPNLTRTGTSQQFRGCHLVSNPYPSYLDWDAVTKTNVSTTMYVRTASGTNYNILETYNSFNGQGTSISGPAMTKYIAPMQGFWVKVEADGQTGSLSMSNTSRSHQTSGSGLRSSAIDFPAYLRFNMIDGQNKDQVILLMSPDAAMTLDAFDSEKMSASGFAQFYSTVNAKKLVINGMKNVKAKTSVPLTLDMPTSKSYTFQAEEFNIEDGLILLEDKQEGVIQDLTINPMYSFFGNAGTNTTRFVVHFQLAGAPVLVGGPMELESLGTDELTTDNIQIVSNNQGTVIIRLDEGFKPEGSIRIFDASGRLVEQTDFNDQETTIQLYEQAGMYFVEVSAGKLMVKKKIVID